MCRVYFFYDDDERYLYIYLCVCLIICSELLYILYTVYTYLPTTYLPISDTTMMSYSYMLEKVGIVGPIYMMQDRIQSKPSVVKLATLRFKIRTSLLS